MIRECTVEEEVGLGEASVPNSEVRLDHIFVMASDFAEGGPGNRAAGPWSPLPYDRQITFRYRIYKEEAQISRRYVYVYDVFKNVYST